MGSAYDNDEFFTCANGEQIFVKGFVKYILDIHYIFSLQQVSNDGEKNNERNMPSRRINIPNFMRQDVSRSSEELAVPRETDTRRSQSMYTNSAREEQPALDGVNPSSIYKVICMSFKLVRDRDNLLHRPVMSIEILMVKYTTCMYCLCTLLDRCQSVRQCYCIY